MHPILVSILLIIAGFAFIFLELLIPSAGLIGIISAILLIAGIVVAFNAGFMAGMITLGVVMVLTPIVIVLLMRIWPYTPIGRKLFSSLPKSEDVEPDAEKVQALQALVGKTGTARSKLLPSGGVTIDGQNYDAVSDGLPIEQGQDIKVVSVRAQRIFVRPIHKELEKTETSEQLSQSLDALGLESIDDPLSQ